MVSSEITTNPTSLPDSDPDFYVSILPRDLEIGMEGPDVTALQSMLLALDYPVEKVDGYFGLQTQSAVTTFQKDYSILKDDGIVGPKTKQVLNTVLSELPDRSDFRVYDRLIATGSTYEVNPFFAEGQSHEFTLTSNSPHISIDGSTITGLSSGTAEIFIEGDGRKASFIFSIRDESEINDRIGDPKNANNLGLGLRSRLKGLESYTGDINKMVLLAGDCYLDERLFLRDFQERFAGNNIYTVALSGSIAEQWFNCIPKINHLQPSSMILNVGINNIRHQNTPSHTVEVLIELFRLIHENMPDTMIYWWNLIPHLTVEEEYYKIAAVNAAILRYSALDNKLIVIDCYTEMANKNGVADSSLYWDMIHPNSAGYDLLFEKTCEAGLEIPLK